MLLQYCIITMLLLYVFMSGNIKGVAVKKSNRESSETKQSVSETCGQLSSDYLKSIHGPAFNNRYMAVENPVQQKRHRIVRNHSIIIDTPDFSVGEHFSRVLSDQPAWNFTDDKDNDFSYPLDAASLSQHGMQPPYTPVQPAANKDCFPSTQDTAIDFCPSITNVMTLAENVLKDEPIDIDNKVFQRILNLANDDKTNDELIDLVGDDKEEDIINLVSDDDDNDGGHDAFSNSTNDFGVISTAPPVIQQGSFIHSTTQRSSSFSKPPVSKSASTSIPFPVSGANSFTGNISNSPAVIKNNSNLLKVKTELTVEKRVDQNDKNHEQNHIPGGDVDVKNVIKIETKKPSVPKSKDTAASLKEAGKYLKRLTCEQKHALETAYRQDKFPRSVPRAKLAQKLGVPKHTVTCWFIKRRENDSSAGKLRQPKLTKEQKTILEMTYKQEGMPDKDDIINLAQDIGISASRVKDWFIYRKAKGADSKEQKTHLTKEQKSVLESVYEKQKYPDADARLELAHRLGLSASTVMYWFAGRRKGDKSDFVRYPQSSSRFSEEQLAVLEEAYSQKRFFDKETRMKLGQELGVPSVKIKYWFYYRKLKDSSVEQLRRSVKRTLMTEEQKNVLESHYLDGSYKDREMLVKISQQLHIPSIKLKYWFYNRQTKDKENEESSSRLTLEQKSFLETSYKTNQFPDNAAREKLALELGVPSFKVKNWFKTRRIKDDIGGQNPNKLTLEQRTLLETAFETDRNPDADTRTKIADELGISVLRVRDWFRNRRIKEREIARKLSEISEEHKATLEKIYEEDQYPNEELREKISEQLGIPSSTVKDWFISKMISANAEVSDPSGTFRFNEEQRKILETSYENNKTLNKDGRAKLAEELGVPAVKVDNWFHNKRAMDNSDGSRVYVRFSPDQRALLEAAYENNRYPDKETRTRLAQELGVSSMRVKCWFNNRKLKDSEVIESPFRLSMEQKNFLEMTYAVDKYPSLQMVRKMAHELRVDFIKVRNWFCSRRAKDDSVAGAPHNRLTEEQRMVLEASYEVSKYPNIETRTKLAEELNISTKKVYFWFQDKRNRDRKESAEFEANPLKITNEQNAFLEVAYSNNRFTTKESRAQFAKELGITPVKVKNWFKRRRAKDRIDVIEPTPQRFNNEQRNFLEMAYLSNKYPSKQMRIKMAHELQVPLSRVENWYHYQRQKDNAISEPRGPHFSHFTEEQKSLLEGVYETDKYPEKDTQERLAQELGVDHKRIYYWFINRRRMDNLEGKSVYFSFSEEQKAYLEAIYENEKYPDKVAREGLAQEMGVEEKKLYYWFFYRRQKDNLEVAGNPNRLSKEQKDVLEAAYCENKYPDIQTRQKLADEIQAPYEKVRCWFITKRKSSEDADNTYGLFMTPDQIQVLEMKYTVEKFPSEEMFLEMEQELDLPCAKIKGWFGFRRAKDRPDKVLEPRASYVSYSDEQKAALEAIYVNEKYPGKELREQLVQELGLQEKKIYSWFANRRQKDNLDNDQNQFKFDSEQLEFLEAAYNSDPFPNDQMRNKYAHELALSPTQIKSWFKRRRSKDKAEFGEIPGMFTEEQKTSLEIFYTSNKFPNKETVEKLAEELETTFDKIKYWFTNKRNNDGGVGDNPNRLTKDQKDILEVAYSENRNPDIPTRQKLADEIQAPYEKVRCWFINRRKSNEDADRFSITPEQKEILEMKYNEEKFPSMEMLQEMENELNIPSSKLRGWFGNRRAKDRTDVADNPSRLTKEQRDVLEVAYSENKNPDILTRQKLADEIQVPYEKVRCWFMNRRKSDEDADASTSQISFTTEQNEILEMKYNEEKSPSVEMLLEIEKELNIPSANLRGWFGNRRAKDRKETSISERSRVGFSKEQIDTLEMLYSTDKFPSKKRRNQLARDLGVTFEKVKQWFVARRRNERDENGELAENPYRMTKEQKDILEAAYNKDKYPDKETRDKLADELNMNYFRVYDWFKRRRKQDGTVEQVKNSSTFTEEQIAILEQHYVEGKNPSGELKTRLSQELGVPFNRVKMWFLDRRLTKRAVSERVKERNRRRLSKRDDVEENSEDTQDSRYGSYKKRRTENVPTDLLIPLCHIDDSEADTTRDNETETNMSFENQIDNENIENPLTFDNYENYNTPLQTFGNHKMDFESYGNQTAESFENQSGSIGSFENPIRSYNPNVGVAVKQEYNEGYYNDYGN